jgi:hypothetical protein
MTSLRRDFEPGVEVWISVDMVHQRRGTVRGTPPQKGARYGGPMLGETWITPRDAG